MLSKDDLKGLDALDSLFCFGYRLVSDGNNRYRLCSAKADLSQPQSVGLLMKEIDESKVYYKNRIIEEGRKLG